MGLFSKSTNTLFKEKFTEAYNFLSNYSWGNLRISDELARSKSNVLQSELQELARRFNDPFEEYFKFYLDSVAGERISVAAALIIIDHLDSHVFFTGERISKDYTFKVLNFARNEVRTTDGHNRVRKLLKY